MQKTLMILGFPGTFAIAFWVIDHIWHLANTNIGLSSVLGGTGTLSLLIY